MRLRSKLAAVAAMVAAMMVVLPGASTAAQSYTITAGGQTSPTPLPYTGVASPVEFPMSNGSLSCVASTIEGVIHLGTHATGEDVGTIDSSTWQDCLGPLGLPIAPEPVHPWSINLTGPAGTVTEGYIGDVVMRFSSEDPGLCSFAITGQAYAYFDEATQTLVVAHTPENAHKVDDPLRISYASGCFGQVVEGEPVYVTAEYVMSNDLGPIDIS